MASTREYDFILFGATGFTGKYVAEELNRIQKEEKRSFKWAAAGRDAGRVKEALEGDTCVCWKLIIMTDGEGLGVWSHKKP